ncbi:MAG: hypothetical protein IPO69_21145 [Saprospiraceae bacterium]|nr:hypothetical protein [Saprospiraceae bacterium]
MRTTTPHPTLSAVTNRGGTTGSFTITNYNATYSYTISPSSGVSRSGVQSPPTAHRNSHFRAVYLRAS